MSGHLSPTQIDLIDQYDIGAFGDAEFRGLALESGLSHQQIDNCIRVRRRAEVIEQEDAAEARHAGTPFGMGA